MLLPSIHKADSRDQLTVSADGLLEKFAVGGLTRLTKYALAKEDRLLLLQRRWARLGQQHLIHPRACILWKLGLPCSASPCIQRFLQ